MNLNRIDRGFFVTILYIWSWIWSTISLKSTLNAKGCEFGPRTRLVYYKAQRVAHQQQTNWHKWASIFRCLARLSLGTLVIHVHKYFKLFFSILNISLHSGCSARVKNKGLNDPDTWPWLLERSHSYSPNRDWLNVQTQVSSVLIDSWWVGS